MNGQKCIDKILKYQYKKNITFDIVFLDIDMPILDGYQTV